MEWVGARVGLAIAIVAWAGTAAAATSFFESLTDIVGDSSQPATRNALAAAGLELANIYAVDAVVVFAGTGSQFGTGAAGDAGRNYLRTIASDYASVPFVAEVTFSVTDPEAQVVFLGLGAGEIALFGTPDWSTQFASTWGQPLSGAPPNLTTFRTNNDVNAFSDTPISSYVAGTHRLQLSFDPEAATAVYAIDLDYAGGAFAADGVAAAVDLSSLFAGDGWPSEPSRIYLGGDDHALFQDFSVVVLPEPAAAAGAWSSIFAVVLLRSFRNGRRVGVVPTRS